MSQDFSSWQREDFQAFDARRWIVFMPTEQEIAAQQAAQAAQLAVQVTQTQTDLAKYNITFAGTETDFLSLYTQYIAGAPDMQEQFGSDLQDTINYQYSIGNTLQAFVNFVLFYEQ